MSLDKQSTMKQSYLVFSECRWGWIRLGNGASTQGRSAREPKNNRCYVSNYRHGGVYGVGMLRSVIETSREILMSADGLHKLEATDATSSLNKGMLAGEEVGVAHSSVDGFVMRWQVN